MKKFLLGVLTMFVLQTGLNYTWIYGIDNDYNDLHRGAWRTLESLKGTPLIDVMTKRCVKDMGKRMPMRDWFQCNKVQIFFSDLIYGEFTKDENQSKSENL